MGSLIVKGSDIYEITPRGSRLVLGYTVKDGVVYKNSGIPGRDPEFVSNRLSVDKHGNINLDIPGRAPLAATEDDLK